jgi:hypothetical protein
MRAGSRIFLARRDLNARLIERGAIDDSATAASFGNVRRPASRRDSRLQPCPPAARSAASAAGSTHARHRRQTDKRPSALPFAQGKTAIARRKTR